ncbi:hypothetical protein A0H81_13782 [Grifola frondosa]|uniref:Uncharacterized protein n=1 Tax=Grifola frondosa TaxID=5627 RepID=A0A1C7LNE8_GRIFR|nr:hypothetical protein A0H81_13782 [Grifola frondosa]
MRALMSLLEPPTPSNAASKRSRISNDDARENDLHSPADLARDNLEPKELVGQLESVAGDLESREKTGTGKRVGFW